MGLGEVCCECREEIVIHSQAFYTGLMGKARTALILAVVDIGSNSVRLKVAHIHGGRRIETLHEARERTRLGANLSTTRRLDEESMLASTDAIEQFVNKAKKLGASEIQVLATAATREARNQADFIAMLAARGIKLNVIDAVQEARLGFLSASTAYDLSRGLSAVFDIGGGSAQIVLAQDGVLCKSVSMPLGAVRLMKQFGGPDSVARGLFQRAKAHVDRILYQALRDWELIPSVVIGTGGTVSSLSHVAALRRLEAHMPSRKSRPISRELDLLPILADMRRLKVEDRGMYLGIHADRADIIVTGLLVADRIMERLGAATVNMHDGGIRDGALLQMVKPGGMNQSPGGNKAAIDALRRKSGDDVPHSSHVTKLASMIFEQLRPKDSTRNLLEIAAKLHDIGQLVDFEMHHRRSAEMIRAAALPGLTLREVEIIACVARYHRKAMPEPTHYHFQLLTAKDKEIVKRLAAVLRVADGLDRTHSQLVKSVEVKRVKGEWQLECSHRGKIDRELNAARDKANLWRRVFGPVHIM